MTLSVALAVRVHEIYSSRYSPSQSPNSSQSQSPCAGSTASGSLPSSGIKFDSQAPSPGLSSHPCRVDSKGVHKSVRGLKPGSTSYSWKRCNRDLSTYWYSHVPNTMRSTPSSGSNHGLACAIEYPVSRLGYQHSLTRPFSGLPVPAGCTLIWLPLRGGR